MLHRRDWMTRTAAMGAATFLGTPSARAAEPAKKRIASINTIYYKLSHAYHITGRMIYGYTLKGKHHQPPFQVARMYNAQYFPDGRFKDLSRGVCAKKGIELAETIPQALGGEKGLDVDAVLLIAEHGDYPRNTRGQILYPRAEMFSKIVDHFKASKKVAPVFVDKHLSYDHVKARAMYDTAKAMGFPLMAGSSLPVTWRSPEWEPDFGAPIKEAVAVYYGDLEILGFHSLEVLQCVLERRKGGETGVKSVRTLRGPAVWKAWDEKQWDPELAEAAMRRSGSRDYATPRDHVADPTAIMIEYLDGTKATTLHLPGYVADFTVAVKVQGDPKPQAAWFVLPSPPGARFFDPLTNYIEEFFTTGKSPYPVERTLLTTTILDFAMRSAAEESRVITDPALKIAYQPVNRSFFFRGPYSDE